MTTTPDLIEKVAAEIRKRGPIAGAYDQARAAIETVLREIILHVYDANLVHPATTKKNIEHFARAHHITLEDKENEQNDHGNLPKAGRL